MESLNSFLDTILNFVGSALISIIGQSILFAGVFLVLSIMLIQFGRKRNWFNRSFGLWTFVAKINYAYLPVLFLFFGLSLGVIKGVHSVAGNVIDAASNEIVEYGQEYVVDFQTFLLNSDLKMAGVSLQDMVDAHTTATADIGWFSGTMLRAFNMMIVRHCLSQTGMKDIANDPLIMIESFSKKDLSVAILSLPSMAMHAQCDYVFWGFFIGLLGVFGPFFMLPIYEFTLHLIVQFVSGKNNEKQELEYTYLSQ